MGELDEGLFYKPFRKVNTFAGLTLKNWFKVLAVLLVGVAVFFLTGLITVQVEESLQASEIYSYRNQLTEARKARKTIETKTELYLNGLENPTPEQKTQATNQAASELSASQKESLEIAKQFKVEASTTDEEIEAMLPRSKTVSQPAMPDPARVGVFIGLPVFFTIVWLMDLRGWSYSSEAKRFNEFRKRQSLYVSKHQFYLNYED